jgi:hypothetical protein
LLKLDGGTAGRPKLAQWRFERGLVEIARRVRAVLLRGETYARLLRIDDARLDQLYVGTLQQELRDALVPSYTEWLASLDLVLDCVTPFVPYDPDGDSWQAPNAAAWGVAWTFLLEHFYAATGLQIPPDIGIQLVWY